MSNEPDREVSDEEERPTDEVREALERIAKDDPDGLIQPEAVVEAARDPKSPLHRFFEWDLTKAAYAHWLETARSVIVSCGYRRGGSTVHFVSVVAGTVERRRGYVSTERAVADPDLWLQVEADARKGIVSWRNRLSGFERAHNIVAKLDEAVAEIDRNDDELKDEAA